MSAQADDRYMERKRVHRGQGYEGFACVLCGSFTIAKIGDGYHCDTCGVDFDEKLEPAPPPKPFVIIRTDVRHDNEAYARAKGYEATACVECGNRTMVRNGNTLKCDACGTAQSLVSDAEQHRQDLVRDSGL